MVCFDCFWRFTTFEGFLAFILSVRSPVMIPPLLCKSHDEVVKSSKKSSEFKMSRWGGLDGRLVPERLEKLIWRCDIKRFSSLDNFLPELVGESECFSQAGPCESTSTIAAMASKM